MTENEIVDLLKKHFVTTKGAAKIIGFDTTNSVNKLVSRGKIRAYKFNGEFLLIPISEAKRYSMIAPGKGGRPKKKPTEPTPDLD